MIPEFQETIISRVSPEIKRKLDELAKQSGQKRSDVIRELLAKAFDEKQQPHPKNDPN